MESNTRYLIDTLTAPAYSGFGEPEQKWTGTYRTQAEAEAAFSALAEDPTVMAAALTKWTSGSHKQADLVTGSWGARRVMGDNPTETVLLYGDRSFIFADSGWYSLPDWGTTHPNLTLDAGFTLSARKLDPDAIFKIKAHPRVCRRDFSRNLYLLEQRPVFPGD